MLISGPSQMRRPRVNASLDLGFATLAKLRGVSRCKVAPRGCDRLSPIAAGFRLGSASGCRL